MKVHESDSNERSESRTIENVSIRARILRNVNQVSALVGSISKPHKRKQKSNARKPVAKKRESFSSESSDEN